MQQAKAPPPKPAPGVVFDSDLGNGIDDILALAVLFGLDTKNEIRVTSISISKRNLKAAMLADAILRYYASGGTGKVPAFLRTLPVGFAEDGVTPEDTKVLTEVLAQRNAENQPKFSTGIEGVNDTAECRALIRNALTAQHDGNAIVILTGPATNLARVLDVHGAKELIERKVSRLVMTCGHYPSGDADFNIATDVTSAKKVLTEWPTPIVVCGKEVADAVRFPGASIDTAFSWATAHPVVEAYRAHMPMPYDAAAAEAAAVLHAVRPNDSYFKLSEPGQVRIREDAGTDFVPAANGKHRYLVVDPGQKETLAKTLVELASLKPVVRRPRFRPQQQQNQEVKPPVPVPPKPPEAKP